MAEEHQQFSRVSCRARACGSLPPSIPMANSKKPRIARIDRFRRRQSRSPTTSKGGIGSKLIPSVLVVEASTSHVEPLGVLPSELSSSTSFEVPHIGQHKRVMFTASEKDSPINCRLEDSCISSDREKKVTTCAYNDPKTSEYAFFKKLKKDAGLRFHSCPLQKDASLPKKPEPTDYSRERTDYVRVSSKGFNTSRIIDEMSTVRTDSFLPPSGGAWNKSDSIEKSSQACGGTFKPQGNQYVHGEIFSRKRQKLRQCVADALFPDTEKFSLKGHDIVSMLLSRLFPMSIKENKYEDLNPGKEMNATGYDLLDSRESDVQFEEHDLIPSRKLLEQSSSYFSYNLLSPMFLPSDERITAHAAFPASHSHKFQPPCSTTEPEYKFGRTPSFSDKCDASLGFLYDEVMNATGYGLLGSQELDVQPKELHQIPCSVTEPEYKFGRIPSFSAKCDASLGFYNEVANATRYGLLDSQEPDVQPKEQHQTPETKILEFEPNSCVRDHLLSPIFLGSNERIIPEASFPTSHSHKHQPPYSITEPECDIGGIPSFTAKSDASLKFLFNEQGHDTFTLDHFKELGKLERKPTPLLLQKDFDCPTDAINLPIAYKYPKPDAVPSLSTSGIGEEMLKNILGECHFSPSSLHLDKPQDIASILDSGLLRYQEFRFGNSVYEEKDDMDMNMNINHTVLPLSRNKHYLKLSADCESDTSCIQDSFHFSPYRHWIRTTACNNYNHHPDSETWLSSSFDFISGQRCLSLTSSHSHYQGSNSSTLELPQREKDMSSLFQIDDNLEPEMDGGNHGEVLYHLRKGFTEMYNSCFLQMSMLRENGWPLPLEESDYTNELEKTHNMIL